MAVAICLCLVCAAVGLTIEVRRTFSTAVIERRQAIADARTYPRRKGVSRPANGTPDVSELSNNQLKAMLRGDNPEVVVKSPELYNTVGPPIVAPDYSLPIVVLTLGFGSLVIGRAVRYVLAGE